MGFGTPGNKEVRALKNEAAPKSSEVVDDATADIMMTRVSTVLKQKGRMRFQVDGKKYTVTVKMFKSNKKDYLQVHFNSNEGDKAKHFAYLFKEENGRVIVEKSSATYSDVPDLDNQKITQIYDWILNKT